ncbi:hypothetical protein MD588_24050 [Photobacterium sp. SDRW27]|uniref:hypothetical protein n=1 Tax=Photobacterium obscurum TaxID=2829490 RepID=UPI0022449751|nr:hypothetical protein [Photobacterium obscurum]MCW8331877.1 hypothetical protein [Photobacterium obscurum]
MTERRLGNLMTVLIPARSYNINCAWTMEKLMPGIELFSCRMLLIFDQLFPSELQNYFGLNDREREVLLDNLLESRLITITPDGYIEASPFLRKHAQHNDGKPTLVKYQERTEEVALDLLTLSVRKPQSLRREMNGLPELLPKGKVGVNTEQVIEAFSQQFRHYLMLSRNNEHERQRTQLYKVMGCHSNAMVQIPVDIEFNYAPFAGGEPQKFTHSFERVGGHRLPLSNELESHIADYLGGQQIEQTGLSCEEYCEQVRDPVLAHFANNYQFDYSSWMLAREKRQTGYGTTLTTGMLGPVYLPDNSRRFLSELRTALRSIEELPAPKVIWYSSGVPLWAANASQLTRFNSDLTDILAGMTEKPTKLTLLHASDDKAQSQKTKRKYQNRFANGIGLSSHARFDRMELLLIPGVIGLVQYHGQPNADSSVTVPIGYITTEPERLQLLENLVATRVENALARTSWGDTSHRLDDLLPDDILAALNPDSDAAVIGARRRKMTAQRSEHARAILSLRRNS